MTKRVVVVSTPVNVGARLSGQPGQRPATAAGASLKSARARYAFLGGFLALGAPVGLLLVRAAAAWERVTWAWIKQEIAGDALTYVYVLLSTTLIMTVAGWFAGRQKDMSMAVSLTDSLTGLPNRRDVQERLRRELQRHRRYQTPLAILLIDIDHLKLINDRLGHEGGDRALQRLAQVLRATCRETDVAGRFAGDEFLVLAPSTGAAQAFELAERIRHQLGVQPESGNDDALPRPLSVSIGIAEAGSMAATPDCDTIIGTADRAMYDAKAAGRDRVVIGLRPPTREYEVMAPTQGVAKPCAK